jgi:thiol-disulfide isomerase/thioredoxin
MMRKPAAWVLACLLMAAAVGAHAAASLPAFKTLEGKVVKPGSLAGKTTVVALFSSTCPFCANEAPKLQKLYRENRQVLEVVAVNIEAGDPAQAAKAAAWVKRFGLTHPVTLDYRAFEAVLGKLKGIPALYVFDRQGKLARSEIGEMLDEDFDDIARDAQRAATAAATAAAHAKEPAVPLASDLRRDAQLAARAGQPLVLFFTLPDCRYCHTVRHSYLATLPGSAYVIREIEVSGSRAVTALDGASVTHAALAKRFGVQFAPTVLFVGPAGEELAPPLKGGDTAGMYGAYLDARFATARQSIIASATPAKERKAP